MTADFPLLYHKSEQIPGGGGSAYLWLTSVIAAVVDWPKPLLTPLEESGVLSDFTKTNTSGFPLINAVRIIQALIN